VRGAADARTVNLRVHPAALRVSYDRVRGLVPGLWEGGADGKERPRRRRGFDFAIHIGMAAGRAFYSVERRAWKRGYGVADVDGRGQGVGEDGRWVGGAGAAECESWVGVPEVLEPDVDVEEVLRRWREAVPVSRVCLVLPFPCCISRVSGDGDGVSLPSFLVPVCSAPLPPVRFPSLPPSHAFCAENGPRARPMLMHPLPRRPT